MAASRRTIEGVADVLIEELGYGQTLKVLQRIAQVPGNASFTLTIDALLKEVTKRSRLVRGDPEPIR